MLNGPFTTEWGDSVKDADFNTVASGYGRTEDESRENAMMVCAALNAVYYMALATGAQHDQ